MCVIKTNALEKLFTKENNNIALMGTGDEKNYECCYGVGAQTFF